MCEKREKRLDRSLPRSPRTRSASPPDARASPHAATWPVSGINSQLLREGLPSPGSKRRCRNPSLTLGALIGSTPFHFHVAHPILSAIMNRRGDLMNWSAIGAVFLALAVGLGAFGAHGLKNRLDAYSLGIWEKAVFYHFIHALGILLVSMLPRTGTFPINGSSSVCWLLAAGVLIFSGSLYTLALTGARSLGAITPVGGVCLIAAWLLLAYYFIAQRV